MTTEPTQAGARLLRWIEDNNRTQAWLADELQVARESLWRWVVGQRTPRIEHCAAIERITGIEAAAWIAEHTQRGAA